MANVNVTLAQQLLDRAAKVSLKEFKSPAPAMPKGATVICEEMPEPLKRLFAVMIMSANAVNDFHESMVAKAARLRAGLDAQDQAIWDEARSLKAQSDALDREESLSKEMFWTSLKHAFPNESKGKDLLVCDGFKLVALEPEMQTGSILDLTNLLAVALGRPHRPHR